MTSERGPLSSMKLRIVLTWVLSNFSSSRLTLVCSGVTFSAWSMILLISGVLAWRSKDSSRPVRILRLLILARMGVSRSKIAKA